MTANRIRTTSEFDVVYLEPVTCEPVLERQRYERLGDEELVTAAGRFASTRWRYTSLRTGWTARFWIAADVIVAYEGAFELVEYEPGPRGPFPRP